MRNLFEAVKGKISGGKKENSSEKNLRRNIFIDRLRDQLDGRSARKLQDGVDFKIESFDKFDDNGEAGIEIHFSGLGKYDGMAVTHFIKGDKDKLDRLFTIEDVKKEFHLGKQEN